MKNAFIRYYFDFYVMFKSKLCFPKKVSFVTILKRNISPYRFYNFTHFLSMTFLTAICIFDFFLLHRLRRH